MTVNGENRNERTEPSRKEQTGAEQKRGKQQEFYVES